MKRNDIAATARQLRAILDAILCGDLDASVAVRTRIEGALAALETLSADDPTAAE